MYTIIVNVWKVFSVINYGKIRYLYSLGNTRHLYVLKFREKKIWEMIVLKCAKCDTLALGLVCPCHNQDNHCIVQYLGYNHGALQGK